MLPPPTLTFTLPSLYDGTTLACRIYHPPATTKTAPQTPPSHRHESEYQLEKPRAVQSRDSPEWFTGGAAQGRKKVVVLAHPYAPLGGSFDDPVLAQLAKSFLLRGWVLATFCFRGSGTSGGRTSWTGKGEEGDLMSVLGFVLEYASCLRYHGERTGTQSHRLVVGGYSYGSLITMNLPPMHRVVERFRDPEAGSAASEVLLRAAHLAEQQNEVLASIMRIAADGSVDEEPAFGRGHTRRSSTARVMSPGSSTCRIGGEESLEGMRRVSHEHNSRSVDLAVRRSIDRMRTLRKNHAQRPPSSPTIPDESHTPQADEKPNDTKAEQPTKGGADAWNFQPAYLLVSPLQGIINNLACMSIPNLLSSRPPKSARSEEIKEAEHKLVLHPTLAIWGDGDGFSNNRRLKAWAQRLETQGAASFVWTEIEGAGHFWVEIGAMGQLRVRVEEWISGL
jgi:predicted alpha/beta-hydrolase family hydrolase